MPQLKTGMAIQAVLVFVLMLVLLLMLLLLLRKDAKPNLKIGVLHSLTGTLASREMPLVDALRLAVEEANQSGGVHGAQVEMVVADCRSDAIYCA